MGKFFIHHPIFAIAIAIATALIGSIALTMLAVEQYPDITPPVVQVQATYDGADAESVNNAVATPIAEDIMGIDNLLYMQTTSANDGSMTIQAIFDIGTDPDINAIMTQNRVAIASPMLPESVKEQGVVTSKTMTSFMMIYSLYSRSQYDDIFLTNYADINIKDELLKISGVGDVMIMGAGEYAMRVWVDPQKMSYYGITLTEISDAIAVQGGVYPAGKLGAMPNDGSQPFTYTIVLPPQLSTAEEFGSIILRATAAEGTIRLSDVAHVELGSQSYDVMGFYDTAPSAMIVIYQTSGSNAVEVSQRVKATMAKLDKRYPSGMECALVVDSSQSIEAGIRDIFRTLLIALALVIFIIYLFLQDWRATLIPLIAIPVSLLGAFILFPLMGFSINIISLLGLVLAIGLVVDDAIVVVEAVQLNISRGMTPAEGAQKAMQSVTSPIIATTIVLLAVFIPVSFMPSITGLLFQQFAIVLAVSVVISAINALTLSPALCATLLRHKEPASEGFFATFNRWFDRTITRYTASVGAVARRTRRTAIAIVVIVAALVGGWQLIPQGFLPEEDQGYVMVSVTTLNNSSVTTTAEAMHRVAAAINSLPSVASVSYAAGYNMLAGISSTNNGILFAELVDYSDRTLTAAQIASQINAELYVAVPEAFAYAFIPPAIPGLGLNSGATFEVQDLEGRGEDYLWDNAQRFMDTLRRSPLTASVTTQYQSGISQRTLHIDIEHAIELGIEPSELYTVVGTMFGSSYINNFNRFGRIYETYVEAAPQFRADEQSLGSIYVTSTSGEQIALSSVAEFVESSGVAYVSQFNLYRSISVTLMPADKVSSAEAMSLISNMANTTLPPDIGIAWSGVSYEQAVASQSGNMLYVLALAFVFLTLAALYNSWSLPLSIILAIPIAIVGALCFTGFAHLIKPLYVNDIYMQISLVMLIALAAKNAILVVEYANRLLEEEGRDLLDATVEAAKLRVRPIIMTAFAFILGVTPLIFASGVYSTARNIMGVTLVGGVLFATIFGVFIYPALYYMVAKVSGRGGKMAAIIVAMICFVGCAPKLATSTDTPPDEWIYGEGYSQDSLQLPLNWWESFGDTTLNALVTHALTYNRDVAVAAANVRSAQLDIRVVRAEYLPSLTANAEGEVEHTKEYGTIQTYTLEPALSWELSLFGALRNEKRSAQASLEAMRWSYRGVQLSMAAQVATTYFTLQQATSNLHIAQHTYDLRLANSALTDSMYRYGMSSAIDLEQSRSLLYAAQSDISTYRRAMEQSHMSLATLLGENPSATIGTTVGEVGDTPLPPTIPIGIPSQLLTRRPDIAEAYYNMQSAAAKVGIARAERYPTIALTAAGGLVSTTLKELFNGAWAWSATADIVQPIFSFGKLKGREQMAREAYVASMLDYEQSMLSAFGDVERALIAIATYGQQRTSATRLVVANQRIAYLVGALYDSGMENYLNVIDAQRELYSAQQTLVNVVAEQYISYVDLYKALGGGF
ncbi:MAG: efflux RND transporter permease subunit [Rikenellaceae bacterium]